MKTVEIPDSLAEQIEAFRQKRGQGWAKELERLLQQEIRIGEWDQEVRRPGSKAARLSEEEVERLAVEAVRAARRERGK
jgi:hypothetical protein